MKNFIHHIVLTVTDSKKSAEFYEKILDWDVVEQKGTYAYLVPDGKKYPLEGALPTEQLKQAVRQFLQ